MKRKLTVAVLAVFVLVLTVSVASAATGNQGYFDWMFNAHKQWVEQAVEGKQITPEQARAWNNHFDQMQNFHRENGFGCPGPGMMGSPGWGTTGGYPYSN